MNENDAGLPLNRSAEWQWLWQHPTFALADIEEFEARFGAYAFYRVIEADVKGQTVKIMTRDHLRRLAETCRNGTFHAREQARRIAAQPIDTWKPDATQ